MLMICVTISARLNVYDYAMEVLIMGFFDLLGKAVSAVVSEAQSQQQRVYKQVERDEKRFSSKSDDELKQIAKDESKAPLERAVASKVYKDRH